ncbi:hypothetical protein ABPG72_000679 [Tetrahymena utriculariae]
MRSQQQKISDSAQRNRQGGEVISLAQQKQERRAVLEASPFANNHETFMKDQILEFYDLFELYFDKQKRGVDINDILATARTLGLDSKYQMVYKVLSQIQSEHHDLSRRLNKPDNVDFKEFIDLLSLKLGNINTEQGVDAIFRLLDNDDDVNSKKDCVTKEKLLKVANDLRYNLNEDEAIQIIQNVAGFQQTEFTYDDFQKFINKKLKSRRQEQLQ